MQSKGQRITLQTYNNYPERYYAGTLPIVEGFQKKFIDMYLSLIGKDSSIFEVGSANGRDADYIDSKGFYVERSDIVEPFIKYNKDRGKKCIIFDVINNKLHQKYDLIIAHTVLLHFNEIEFDKAISNIHKHLNDKGYFACIMKKGKGEEYSKKKMNSLRYFKYYSVNELKAYFNKGFTIEYENVIDDNYIHLLLRKNKNTY